MVALAHSEPSAMSHIRTGTSGEVLGAGRAQKRLETERLLPVCPHTQEDSANLQVNRLFHLLMHYLWTTGQERWRGARVGGGDVLCVLFMND